MLLCLKCHITLFFDTFSSHVKAHFKQKAKKEKQQNLLARISSLQLFTASHTFSLIQQSSSIIFAFLELVVYKNAFSCNLCSQVLLSMQNMKRHCTKNHSSDFKNTVTSFIIVQSLLKNRFFFQVQARLKSTTSYSRPAPALVHTKNP